MTDFKILIADDEPGTIRVLSEILKSVGKIYFTTHGTHVLELAKNILPDIILLDIEMPDMTGFEICEQIRRDAMFTDTPILFVTAQNGIDQESRALTSGAIDFIHKPPHPVLTKARVSNYLALKRQTDELRMLSMQDGLTNIANRRAFDKALSREWQRACRSGHSLSLIMLDIDFFKSYNDRYGHLAGDDCLRAVANCLARHVKRPSDVVARYGGEELAVLLPGCGLEEAYDIAESIRQEVSRLRIAHAGSTLPSTITVSAGIATTVTLCQNTEICWRKPGGLQSGVPCGLTENNLIKRADRALYTAKNSGRNCVRT
ncbi:diguanylate cyclase [Methylomonas sp. OY6]|uniref:diguanylate cyclase n=1 Tax=Methylomonas defluvii TaxID=3045149 RepID=A0ABU4U9K6_9GAMM|nr:diguanylate cyclase [Methylomonas sp. OY6]MDX8125863.1 diguanylate cyclase [Methylomonas sp. OY6]